ncbi:MAG TPA: VOC family protein [Solirubrobacterales bacterium]|nr:VOC family protein [Solirubrobacterales bacterium]
MSKVTSYAPGTPCWVDIMCADLEASQAFYADLLGWRYEPMVGENVPGYPLATYEGDRVAGLMPAMGHDGPQMWSTHISVADADESAAKVTAAGGKVLAPPFAVFDLGRAAVCADPGGAVFELWEPGGFAGAERVNGPGALAWNELGTRDVEGAKAFYGAVFGWTAEEHELQRADGGPGPAVYVEWKLDGKDVGGMMDISGMLPAEVPAHWLVYFGVEDADAAVEKVKAAGGEVRFGPVDIAAGRFAVVTEPHADPGVFAVIKLPD